ncbi:Serine/threonine phosphatase stp [Urinicoccus massiliensis]|uniref:Serine/threonine phosphatase stp n=1 Tax=Urinicoccus massiliensis TaxID=1723382 RepID=A0A8H2M8G7_9FIRM|nr:Stp1/IreP family PP2C-type Ser/Thr phosphatase [Urinicoccus massiliensis]VFB16230.1 Serine/threonine phosphatase stp [Urinicoccus massiliensis]
MIAYGATNVGKVRKNNEDAFKISNKDKIYLLADGMGGHLGGEFASSMAVQELEKLLVDVKDKAEIKEAIEEVNRKIYQKSLEDENLSGMGTTLSLIKILDDHLYFANIGDSRIYCLKGKDLIQLTIDDSYVNYLLEVGAITSDQAKDHPKKNVLLKALGTTEDIEVFIQEVQWEEDDLYLLCSDGLTNMLEEEEIQEIISSNEAEKAVDLLINQALDRGGKDNITVIVLTIKGGAQ